MSFNTLEILVNKYPNKEWSHFEISMNKNLTINLIFLSVIICFSMINSNALNIAFSFVLLLFI